MVWALIEKVYLFTPFFHEKRVIKVLKLTLFFSYFFKICYGHKQNIQNVFMFFTKYTNIDV